MGFSNSFIMGLALKKARQGVRAGQAPFGACIVKGNSILSCEHNRVWELNDITAHAEIVAIREACQVLKSVNLSGCTLYSTCEPCPMCFSAIHWAKIDRVVYGTTIEDAKLLGFSELSLSNQKIKEWAGLNLEIVSGFMREESLGLFSEWSARFEKKIY